MLKRGISNATAQRFHVGRAQGKTNLFPYLSQKGVPAEIIAQCGLLNKNGNDLFQNHVVFPIYLGDQVVDFIGRDVGDKPDYPKYWRLPRERVITGHSHFNWDINRSEMILVEGVMDALSLIEKGFDYAVATDGTNGLNEMLLRRSIALGLKKVWVCFDGDDAGRKRGLVLAYKLADMGLKVKIVTLPDGQDPNDFLLTHPAEDFAEYEQIHPALHFGWKETLITYPFLGEDGWVPWVITSERELFRLTRDELRGRG